MIHVIGGLTRFNKEPDKFITRKYNVDEKKRLLDYMRSFEPYAAAGYVDDCKTGKETRIYNAGYNDGTYCWSDQDIYHIEKYNAAVKEEFLEHITLTRQ